MSEWWCCWLSVNKIVEKMGFTKPTISHHLAVLRDADLVNIRKKRKQTFYSLYQKHVAVSFWQIRLNFASGEKATEVVMKVVNT
jgi:DNA-binding transcriptional ArsR family regulator